MIRSAPSSAGSPGSATERKRTLAASQAAASSEEHRLEAFAASAGHDHAASPDPRDGEGDASFAPTDDGDERHNARTASDEEEWHARARFGNAIEHAEQAALGTDQ